MKITVEVGLDAMYATAARTAEGERRIMSTRSATRGELFGNVALILFLLAQVFDGALTYVGLSTYGAHMEGNPLISWLISAMGEGPALATAKLAAGTFGIALHLSAVHKAVALLAGFYIAVAVVPWVAILFYLPLSGS